jgi:hypothetical protein
MSPFQNGEMGMKALLDSVPTLVKAFGKWPSYFVVVLGAVHGVVALVLIVILHHALK